jgi:hypothetical protein
MLVLASHFPLRSNGVHNYFALKLFSSTEPISMSKNEFKTTKFFQQHLSSITDKFSSVCNQNKREEVNLGTFTPQIN